MVASPRVLEYGFGAFQQGLVALPIVMIHDGREGLFWVDTFIAICFQIIGFQQVV